MPFEVPEGWCWCRLEDYFELLSGQDFPPEKYNDAQNGIPYIIGASNLYMGKIVINRWTQTPSVKTTKGDLLVVCKGAGVGKMALNDIGDMHIARQIQAIRDVSKMMSIEYIKMVVSYYIEDIIADANGLIPGLKRELLLSLLMPIPPLQEQRRIITTFEKLMSFIESIDNDSLELTKAIKIAQSKILDLAIHGKLVPQDASDEPASELLKRINSKAVASCDNPHYEGLPNGWTVVPISTLCDLLSGRDLPISDCNDQRKGIPYLIGASNLINGEFDFVRWTDKPQVVSVENDLLISCKGTIGDIIANNVGKIHIARQFMAIRIKHSQIITENYLKIYILACLDTLKKKARGVIPGIAREDVLSMDILLPPITEQRRIVDKTEELYAQLNGIEKSLQA